MPTLKPLSILALVAVLGGCGLIRSNTQFIADRDAACAKHGGCQKNPDGSLVSKYEGAGLGGADVVHVGNDGQIVRSW